MTLDEQIEEVEQRIHEMWDSFPRRDTEMLGLCRDLLELIREVAGLTKPPSVIDPQVNFDDSVADDGSWV